MNLKYLLPIIICLISQIAPAQNSIESAWGSTDVRYVHNEKPKDVGRSAIELTAWRGERVNAQFVVWNDGEIDQEAAFTLSNLTDKQNNDISRDNISAGFVETVVTDTFSGCGRHEVDKHGTYVVADMIDNKKSRVFALSDTRGAWMTVQIPQEAKAGIYKASITVESQDGTTQVLKYSVKVLDRILPSPHKWNFHLDFWQNPYAIARVHQVDLWSEEHFEAMRPYILMLASAGQKVITTSLIDKPWNGQTLDPFGSWLHG